MSVESKATFDREILLFPYIARDGELTHAVLTNAGLRARIVRSVEELAPLIHEAGAVIIAEEQLRPATLKRFQEMVAEQPPWSDISLLIVTSETSSTLHSNDRVESILSMLPNVTLLERPVRLATLLTIAKSALSSRNKQFELSHIMQELERGKIIAEQANQAKSTFLANMSHEIRTPLGAIVGFTDLLSQGPIDAQEASGYLERIGRNSKQLSQLIDEVLDLSKIEAQRLEVEKVPVDLVNVLEDVFSATTLKAQAKGLSFEGRRHSQLPKKIFSDPTRLRQILINLVGNAVKFTEKGSVRVDVDVTGSESPRRLEVRVIDTGIGLTPDQAALLFSPFSQADNSISRKYGGTGLGLALSQKLARLMGGDLQLLKSEFGHGSTFLLTLILNEDVPLVDAEGDGATEPFVDASVLKGKRLLIVDDSPDNRFLVCRYLEKLEVLCETANDGEEALVRVRKEAFDLVLMDLQMPKLDGYHATLRLRAEGYRLPIVALTANALQDERSRCLAVGFDGYVTKPIDAHLLIDTLSLILHSHRRAH